jgi:hypothetical protein
VDDLAFVAGNGLTAVDVSDPLLPRATGRIGGPGFIQALAVRGDFAYVACDLRSGGWCLTAIDVSPPVSAGAIGGVEAAFPLDGPVSDIGSLGSYACFTLESSNFRVFDFSKPAKPRYAGEVFGLDSSLALAIEGDLACVLDVEHGVAVIDLTNPRRPKETGEVAMAWGHPRDLVAVESHAYVPDPDNGVWVVDFSDPADPVSSGPVSVEGGPFYAAEDNGHLYLAGSWETPLQVMDLSDPDAPTQAGKVDGVGLCRGLAAGGGYVYLATEESHLRIFDVSMPGAPSEVWNAGVPPLDSRVGLALDGEALYLTAANELRILDVSNPAAPRVLGGNMSVSGRRVAGAAGDLFFVSGQFNLLEAYPRPCLP